MSIKTNLVIPWLPTSITRTPSLIFQFCCEGGQAQLSHLTCLDQVLQNRELDPLWSHCPHAAKHSVRAGAWLRRKEEVRTEIQLSKPWPWHRMGGFPTLMKGLSGGAVLTDAYKDFHPMCHFSYPGDISTWRHHYPLEVKMSWIHTFPLLPIMPLLSHQHLKSWPLMPSGSSVLPRDSSSLFSSLVKLQYLLLLFHPQLLTALPISLRQENHLEVSLLSVLPTSICTYLLAPSTSMNEFSRLIQSMASKCHWYDDRSIRL